MNNKKKLGLKTITMTSILIASLFMVQPKNAVAKETSKNKTQQNVKNLGIPVEANYYSKVSTNMLDINTSVIAKATMVNLFGEDTASGVDNKIIATFDSLPQTGEKIIAVLTDKNAGGVVQAKFLDENNTVTFEKIPRFVGIPGIHLYRQSASDPDFVLRNENFIASTSYILPYYAASGEAKGTISTVWKKDGTSIPSVAERPQLYLYDMETYFNLYGIRIPNGFLSSISAPEGTTFKDILAVIIPEYADGKPINQKEPHKQCVASKNLMFDDELCKFDFELPPGVENVGIHLYKNSLEDDNLLCTFSVKNINND